MTLKVLSQTAGTDNADRQDTLNTSGDIIKRRISHLRIPKVNIALSNQLSVVVRHFN